MSQAAIIRNLRASAVRMLKCIEEDEIDTWEEMDAFVRKWAWDQITLCDGGYEYRSEFIELEDLL